MAQTNSVQREPSMEEILASIRKIIEESDQAAQPAAAETAAEAVPAEDPDEPRGGVIEVEAFRADLRSRAEAARSEPPVPTSLAAVQAAVGRSGEVTDAAAVPSADREDGEASTWLEAGEATPPYWETGTSARDAEASPETGAASGPDMTPATAATGSQDEMIAELSRPRGPWEMERAAAESGAGRPAILSEETGRQVAASFGELTDAFAASRRRSFDEMAEEMIRPMLQDWLDNNLPMLVERLVREEIERVARGGAG
jgi:cell pole-organizing protein PopZ